MTLTHFSVLSAIINTRKSRRKKARLASRQTEAGESNEFKANLDYLSQKLKKKEKKGKSMVMCRLSFHMGTESCELLLN